MRAFLLLLLLLFVEQLRAENEVVRYLTVEDGLTQNEITGIIQDTKGYMWFASRGGLNRYDGYEFLQFKPKSHHQNSLSNPSIECLYEDREGRLWIGTKSGGVDLYDPRNGRFRHFRNDENSKQRICDNRIISIHEQENGNIWLGGWSGGLNIWIKEKDSLEHHLQGHKVSVIKEDANKNVWIGTNNGLYLYDSKALQFRKIKITLSNNCDVNDLAIDSQRNVIWVTAWDKGLIKYNMLTGKYRKYYPKGTSNLQNRFNRNSYSILLDSKNKLYVGTWGGGLYSFDPEKERFTQVMIKPGKLGELNTDYDIILEIIEDKSGTIWIGTDGGGVCRIGAQLPFQSISIDNSDSGIENYHVLCILEDRDEKLWLGTKGGGLYFSDDRKKFQEIPNLNPSIIGPDFKAVKCIYESADGTIWVGTNFGLHQQVSLNGKRYLKNHQPFGDVQIRKILSLLEKDSCLFVGTQQQGFWIGKNINTEEESWKQFAPSNNPVLKNERISLIRTDKKNRVWVGSYKGIYFFDDEKEEFERIKVQNNRLLTSDIVLSWCQYNDSTYLVGTPSGLNLLTEKKNGTFRVEHYYKENGLPDDYIHALVTDKEENLWISTNNGISRFNVLNGKISNYDISDGLQGRSFSEDCVFMNAKGEIFFGGTSGFNYFNPARIKDNQNLPEPVIISLNMHNRKVNAGEELHGRVILEEDISYTEKLTLTHREREFSLHFSAMGYDAPERNNYAYRLLNYDKHWNYSGTNRSVTYNQLRAGNYVFEVKASNNHGVWNEEPVQLQIRILPAPWKSWWAIMIYIIIALALVALIRWVAVKQSRMSHSLELEKLQREQALEINEMKLRFFTNISHEFRTPLTLILAPVQELLSLDKLPKEGKRKLKVIEQNSKRLLALVGQLLDFRKAETGKMSLSVQHTDAISFVKGEMKAFYGLAESKNVLLKFEAEASQMMLWFDTEKLAIVINNLLSNAFKYVSDHGEICVKLTKLEDKARIEVIDNGQGIPKDELNRIFDRFYQVEDALYKSTGGSGIGLALCKRIIELHKGSITAQSTRNVETVFVIDLLLGKEHFSPEQMAREKSFVESKEKPLQQLQKEEKPVKPVVREGKAGRILIVEDQEDINNYIADFLRDRYEVIQKFDGVEGYANCLQSIPDLVISDVMMPGMDGFELCEKLKKQERTAHIPIILLTAKTADQYKIKGITKGADAYVTKPFNTDELLARINTLLKNRSVLKETFSKKVKLDPSDVEITSFEEEFIKNAVKIVEGRMHDHNFNAEELASSLNMSTSTLYRRLKQLTNMSTNIFIRSVRLKRAAQLLADPQKTIAEISTQVGISDLKYFRKCFREMFDSSPSEYRQNIKNE